jgi:hypothetical protein
MTSADRLLSWLIRANAAILLCAAAPIFFPTELMAEMHQRLGLGTLARDRLTEYLTRSASACYAMHGAVLLVLATDVRRYRRFIDWMYVIHFLFALTMLGIDLFAGMPGWWTVAEVGTIGAVAVTIFTVNQVAKRSPANAVGDAQGSPNPV